MPLLALLAYVAVAVAADTGPRVVAMGIEEPRAFGYFLGDELRRAVVLDLRPDAKLDAASLPRPGPVNYWLDLTGLDVDEEAAGSGTRVRITLTYQAFYSALDPRQLTIPGFTLKVSDASGTEDAEVPAWSFVVAPLRELFPGKETEGSAVALRPDAPPRLIPTGGERTALLAAGLVAVATLVLLAAHFAWGPFRRRAGRPFTEAARFLRSHAAQLSGDGGYRAALLKLHRAFDVAAGRRILPDDLPAFLDKHPEFAPMSQDIDRVFTCSRATFYGGDVAHARAQMPVEAIAKLVARLGAAERRAS